MENNNKQIPLLPPPLSGMAMIEFMAGKRKLNVTEQGQFRAESPCLWALYFADYDTLARFSAEKLGVAA